MVFKIQTVRERLKFLQETIEKLEKVRQSSHDEFLENYEKYWSGEHGLHLAAEAVFDIGNHIVVGNFGEHPKGYDDIIPRLVEKKVISKDLGKRFSKVGGFRNILVHEYMTVDKEKVFERLQNGLEDFKIFMKEVFVWLEKQH